MKYDMRWVMGWVAFVVAFLAFEFTSLLDGNDATPPLTQVAVRWLPWWAVAGLIGWLGVHFGKRYLDKRRRG